jgi:septal ring factor EnvC (AmiA/AmiB activator)
MIHAIGPGFIERELNNRAREQYDLYAVLVPYRVRISTEPDSAEAVARMREKREKRRAAGARAKAEAQAERLRSIRAYVSSNLSLESVRVAPGERFGRTVDGVFGTIVNNGA